MTEDPGVETAKTGRNATTVIGDVQLRHLPEFHSVALTVRGPCAQVGDTHARLKSWCEDAGAYATGSPVGFFYERGWVTADASRYSLCIPTSKNEAEAARTELASAAATDGAIDVREIPRALVAAIFYRGPVAGTTAALDKVAAWIKERPYLPAGASRVVYLAEPGVLGDGLVEVEIQQPVIPKPR